MKRIMLFLMTVSTVLTLSARTFTMNNADGVAITYTVITTEPATVNVAAGNYTGQVVVPETVNYKDTVWTVVGLDGGAFYNTTVTYVRLPQTVHTVSISAFKECPLLDSLRFDATEPMEMERGYMFAFGNDFPFGELPVYVPCGYLRYWKTGDWLRFNHLTTSCAHRLTVIDSLAEVVRTDSIIYDGHIHYSSGNYELGDSALLVAKQVGFGFFIGWSDGNLNMVHVYLMPDHDDTIICYADTMHYSNFGAGGVQTPVYGFGSLSYGGQPEGSYTPGNYHFRGVGGTYDTDGVSYDYLPSSLYASSLWVGSGEHVAAGRYGDSGVDFRPGPLTADGKAGTNLETIRRFSRVWHVTRAMVDYHIAHCGEEGYVPVDDILTWPGNGDTSAGFAAQLAPYYDADSNGRYQALAGDYPIIRGDEAVFSIFNDACQHGESAGLPLGIEVHSMIYSFNEPQDTALWSTVFAHYDIYNRSSYSYGNTYLGMWSDFDIGYSWDDYIGCDVSRSMYYGYNGNDEEPGGFFCYNGVPPAQGCVILGGVRLPADSIDNPAINEVPGAFATGNTYGNMGINGTFFGDGIADNERMGMTHFHYYNNSTSQVDGEPTQGIHYYNYLHSVWKNGTHVKYGGNGVSNGTELVDATFMYPGTSDPWNWGTDGMAPVDTNWSEATAGNMPGDRRGIGSSGPFTFLQSSVEEFDVAFVTSFSTVDVASAIATLQRLTDDVRREWQHDTIDSGRPFAYMPYSAPHEVGVPTTDGMALRLYPNPTRGLLTVVLDEASEMQLYDMMGRCVMTAVQATAGSTTLDLSPLPRGIYLLRVHTRTGTVTKRVAVAR